MDAYRRKTISMKQFAGASGIYLFCSPDNQIEK